MIGNIDISYPMFPHQRLFHEFKADSELTVKAIITGYGGGKTHAGSRELLKLAIDNAPIPVLGIEPTYPMIRDIMLPSLEEMFDEYGIQWGYNVQAHNVTLPEFNAHIWLRSGDSPARLKGPNVAAAVIDEPFIQDRGVYKQISARIRHPRAVNKVLALTGTPEGLGWGYEELVEKTPLVSEMATPKGTVRVYQLGNRRIVEAPSVMNEVLTDDYFDTIRSTHTEQEIEAYIEGRFVNMTQGRVYYAYSEANDKPVKLDYNLPVIVSCDFNAGEKPMSWNVMQEQNGAIHVRYALWKQYTNTRQMCEYLHEVLKRESGQMPGTVYFYGDYAGSHHTSNSAISDWETIEDYFFRSGLTRGTYRIQPCRSIRDSAAAFNAMLRNAKGEIRCFLHPGEDTDHLRKDCLRVAWKENSMKEDDTEPLRTHSGANMRYYCDFEHSIIPKARRTH